MTNFLDELKKFDTDVNYVAEGYMDLQLKCMLLHYAGQIKMNAGDTENGALILGAVNEMRKVVNNLWNTYQSSIGVDNMQRGFERIRYKQKLYSSITDDVIAANATFFPLPPRPAGAEFYCDKDACMRKINILAADYFQELWTNTISNAAS